MGGKTLDKPLVSRKSLANKPLPNPGEPVGPLPVSQGSGVAVPTGQAKPLLVTCAEPVGCSLLSKPGENGTECATSTKGGTLPPPLLPPLECQDSLWLKVTMLNLPEMPLVVDNNVEECKKTKDAVEVLKRLGAFEDVKRVYATRRNRAGRGKSRGRKHVQKLGPLIVYKNDNGVVRAFRNIPGVELMNVNAMNVLRLAPGGHVGRFVIFTENAFSELNSIYGDFSAGSSAKKNWSIPSAIIQNSDLQSMLQSEEIQSVLNAPKESSTIKRTTKKNPLTNIRAMLKLNPNAATLKRAAWREEANAKKAKSS